MWRNDTGNQYRQTSSSGNEYTCTTRNRSMVSNFMAIAGGVGLGAGLLYLLDPDKGMQRRRQIADGVGGLGRSLADSAASWGSSAGEYTADTARGLTSSAASTAGKAAAGAGGLLGGALSGVANLLGEKLDGARDYAHDRTDAARHYLQDKICPETRAEHRIAMGICALSSMAVGAALMYVFDPAMGRTRRQLAVNQSRDLASQATDYARNAASTVSETVTSGISTAKDKVTGLTQNLTGSTNSGKSQQGTSNGGSCPPGFTSVPSSSDVTL
jgi:hypothetical protein